MNTYARDLALESGTIRMTEIKSGDSIYCRHSDNGFKYVPSRIVRAEPLFGGKIIRLTHGSGATTEHSHDSHARLAS